MLAQSVAPRHRLPPPATTTTFPLAQTGLGTRLAPLRMALEVDRALLQTLADLTRLQIPTEQQVPLARRLADVVQAFSALAAVPTAGVEPSPYPLPLPTVLRADEAEEPLAPAVVIGNAARSAAGAFLVPRVIDG